MRKERLKNELEWEALRKTITEEIIFEDEMQPEKYPCVAFYCCNDIAFGSSYTVGFCYLSDFWDAKTIKPTEKIRINNKILMQQLLMGRTFFIDGYLKYQHDSDDKPFGERIFVKFNAAPEIRDGKVVSFSLMKDGVLIPNLSFYATNGGHLVINQDLLPPNDMFRTWANHTIHNSELYFCEAEGDVIIGTSSDGELS